MVIKPRGPESRDTSLIAGSGWCGERGSSSIAFMRELEGLPLPVFVAHVVEGIQAPGDFNRLCVDLFNRSSGGPGQ